MSHEHLLETIRELPVVDQVALAEAILEGVRLTLPHCSPKIDDDRDLMRGKMREAAQDALNYYRNDPDVALWQGLEGDPFHEYDARSNLAGEPDANGGGGNN